MISPGTQPLRRYEFDWLRVLVIVNLIPWHAAWLMLLIPGFCQIPKAGVMQSTLLDYFLIVLPWQMPLLFFIAGISARTALGIRSSRAYLVERVKRLLVPLVFGMLVWFPLMFYFWPGTEGSKSVLDYVLRFWPETIASIHSIARPGRPPSPGWSHLWFLAYLLLISLTASVFKQRLTQRAVNDAVNGRADNTLSYGWVVLPAIPLIVIITTMSPVWPLYQNNLFGDLTWFCVNATVFYYGLLFGMRKGFLAAVDGYVGPSSVLALVLGGTVVWFGLHPILAPSYTANSLVYSVILGFDVWIWIIALFGLSRRFLRHTNAFLNYFRNASYPVYFLHFFLMVIVGYWIAPLALGAATQFLMLVVLTGALSLFLYESLVRRTRVTRFLFGLK